MSQDSQNVVFKYEDMNLVYEKTEKGLGQISFFPGEKCEKTFCSVPFPNFQISIAGIPYGFMPALTTGYSEIPVEMYMKRVVEEKDRLIFEYSHEVLKIAVTVDMKFIPKTNVIRLQTTVQNHGSEEIVLSHVSSMCMQGIATEGIRKWYDKRKIKVHYCMQTWQGEGQWRSADLEELGLYPNSVHPCAAAIHFSSVGSWSTGRFLPMVVLEDIEMCKVWYFQIETSANWHFEIGHRGRWDDATKGSLYIHADGADERFGGWSRKLLPGDSFTAIPVSVGCCCGDFNDAVRELTKYRRSELKPKNAWKDDCPVIFNDYMNCLWGNPTREKLLPLIDAAVEVGAECFCIDAGWFSDLGTSWGKSLGDWEPSKNRFGEEGLQGVIRYIKSKGMISGLWLEMEVCGEDSKLGKMPDSWFLMRNGKRVGGGERWFLNFVNPDVRTYIHGVIDRLMAMGVRYFKNDYNACVGNGDDTLGNSAAEGLMLHMNAFYSFVDEVRLKYPDLILENCGSGAMRQDYGILSRFHIQSSSDQEIYHNYPSILCGSIAGVLPEQLGIWAYPYPLLFMNSDNPEVLESEEYQQSMKDGEQTIFNIVNGMCGNLYLSGHLEAADSLNMHLIKEGVCIYKTNRKFISHSYPFWPIGFIRINDKDSWAALGFASEDSSRVLLAIWRLGSTEEYKEFPINGWLNISANVKQIYPSRSFETDFDYNARRGTLTVHFSKNYQARLFELVKT